MQMIAVPTVIGTEQGGAPRRRWIMTYKRIVRPLGIRGEPGKGVDISPDLDKEYHWSTQSAAFVVLQ